MNRVFIIIYFSLFHVAYSHSLEDEIDCTVYPDDVFRTCVSKIISPDLHRILYIKCDEHICDPDCTMCGHPDAFTEMLKNGSYQITDVILGGREYKKVETITKLFNETTDFIGEIVDKSPIYPETDIGNNTNNSTETWTNTLQNLVNNTTNFPTEISNISSQYVSGADESDTSVILATAIPVALVVASICIYGFYRWYSGQAIIPNFISRRLPTCFGYNNKNSTYSYRTHSDQEAIIEGDNDPEEHNSDTSKD